jgi:hypothetical protein
VTFTPVFQAATIGYEGNAGHVNQFLTPHTSTFIYTGTVLQGSSAAGSSVYLNTNDQFISQQFTTGTAQTAISQIWIQVSSVGGSAITDNIDPLVVSIYADSGGFPTGSALATSFLTETAIYASGFWVVFLIPVSGLSAATPYHIVTSPAGVSGVKYYVWQESVTPGGALTSSDGADWTFEPFGLMYQVYDQTASGLLQYVVSDNGLRKTTYGYPGSSSLISSITEYTVDQTGTSSVTYTRSLTYDGVLLTGVN